MSIEYIFIRSIQLNLKGYKIQAFFLSIITLKTIKTMLLSISVRLMRNKDWPVKYSQREVHYTENTWDSKFKKKIRSIRHRGTTPTAEYVSRVLHN
jgi:hypothetical protein